MKKLIAALCMFSLTLGLCCAETPQGWLDDPDAAFKEAGEKNLPVLLLFTGSEWCPACKMLKRETLSSREFSDYVQGRVVPLYIDMPRRLTPGARSAMIGKLAQKYDLVSLPLLCLINPHSPDKEVARLEYAPRAQFMSNLKAAVETADAAIKNSQP